MTLRELAEAAVARPNGAVRTLFDEIATPSVVLGLLDRIDAAQSNFEAFKAGNAITLAAMDATIDRQRDRITELEGGLQSVENLFESVGKRYRDRIEELEEALASVLRGGEHDGPCDNDDGYDSCSIHVETAGRRKAAARELLGENP